jgi:hypothetical protein
MKERGQSNISHILHDTGFVSPRVLAEYSLDMERGTRDDDLALLDRLVEDAVITPEQRKEAIRLWCHTAAPDMVTSVRAEQQMVKMRLSTIIARAQKILDKNGHRKSE